MKCSNRPLDCSGSSAELCQARRSRKKSSCQACFSLVLFRLGRDHGACKMSVWGRLSTKPSCNNFGHRNQEDAFQFIALIHNAGDQQVKIVLSICKSSKQASAFPQAYLYLSYDLENRDAFSCKRTTGPPMPTSRRASTVVPCSKGQDRLHFMQLNKILSCRCTATSTR